MKNSALDDVRRPMRPRRTAGWAPRLVAVLALVAAAGAWAQAPAPEDEEAGDARSEAPAGASAGPHAAFVGEPFFVLTDATFGSAEEAKVRVEVNDPHALDAVGGIDVRLYRVAQPLPFLQRQRNLHRVQVEAPHRGEGLANTLTHLWDSWVVKSRSAWQKLFSADARSAVVDRAPELKTSPDLRKPSVYEEPLQFDPIPGLALADRFRYPLQVARPIALPKGVALEGSSSGFLPQGAGNVFVPLGRRAPGLYLVEVISGQHRATTLLFVSDTVALTKVAADQMLAWAARRADGQPVPRTRVVWSDGLGVLKSGEADAQGIVRLDRKAPEQTYLFGEDPAGGVFISENFYYDSEVYTAKVYAVTDRPLYRAGDWVEIKMTGRDFRSARDSARLQDADVALAVVDPAGQVIHAQAIRFSGAHGADARFALPPNAAAGGYEIRLGMGGDVYTTAFRVADFQKPHFEIDVVADKADFVSGEAVGGRLQLHYPDGKPVAGARVTLTARSQKLAMVEGELDYTGQFALKLAQDELRTDDKGVARFSLPACDEPSRYVLTALATDGAAYRVRTSKEILVERGSASYRVAADRQFSAAGEAVRFAVSASPRTTTDAAPPADGGRPARWEWVRLEDRQRQDGAMPAGDVLPLQFPRPGTYSVTLRDGRGRIVGRASHWVSGDGVKAPAGSIEIVADRASYRAGDTADLLLSFPEPVDVALVTLERDRVEATALLGQEADWVASERIAPTQWRLRVAIREAMSPNITVSVAYMKHGDYVFQNQGLRVEQPRIDLAYRTDKAVYAPGETVRVDVTTTLAGKPVSADVVVGIVDEMIYVLQPEIAPPIEDFFYYPRRNNVRTSASLSFIGYDLATNRLGALPSARQVNPRAVKVLERPRRENVDTASWQPRLATDAAGHASFAFTMPDSLTRWRITGRAIDANGVVGQKLAWIRSDKPFFAKWTSPAWQREGDKAQASIAIFNQTGAPAALEWEAVGAGDSGRHPVTVQPGANFVSLPLAADKAGGVELALALRQDGRVVDRLQVPVRREPVAWMAPRQLALDLSSGSAALKVPADATNLRVSLAADPAAGEFNRWVEDLIDYPYGCVEQTASRMIPLSIALQSLSVAQQPLAAALAQRLAAARLSLAQMAGPQAQFGWWGRGMRNDPFLTIYAYYADWRATQALHIGLPPENWQRLLEVYAKGAAELPAVQRALALAWMQEIGLPVGSMAAALVDALVAEAPSAAQGDTGRPIGAPDSLAMVAADDPVTRDVALLLAAWTSSQGRRDVGAAARAAADDAASRLAKVDLPLAQALLLATHRRAPEGVASVLAQVGPAAPTFDRAQALAWLQRAGAGQATATAAGGAAEATLRAPWRRGTGAAGAVAWEWPAGVAAPATIEPAPGKAAWAFVRFDSREPQAPALAAQLQRRLWHVVPAAAPAASTPPDAGPAADANATEGGRKNDAAKDREHVRVALEPVRPGTALDADALYLDELDVRADKDLRWAIVEAALPPGAAVETGTWGIDVVDAGKAQPLERAQDEPTAQGYAVPFDSLAPGAPVTVRHLVRFSQRGVFKLPPARLYRMYQPQAKAFEGSGGWATVEVK